jgi:hypothetical protein
MMQVLGLMESISEAEAMISRRAALEMKMASLHTQQEEMAQFQARLEQCPAIQVCALERV